jgi:hypothetical protein
MWQQIKSVFTAEAAHTTVQFVPDPNEEPLQPHRGYLRVWLAEGYLAKSRTWGNDHFPTLHGGAALTFGGRQQTTFARFTRAPEAITAPGAQLNFPLTPLLPYEGGVVELEAALFRTTSGGPLATAADLVGALGPLLGPPLSTAAAVTERISAGLDSVVKQNDSDPVLALHQAFRSAMSVADEGPRVRSGYLLVANTPPGTFGKPVFTDGLLHVESPAGLVRPTGVDYLVLHLECRTEHDSWRLAQFDEIIRAAGTAYLNQQPDTFKALRIQAITAAWNSTDFVQADRVRVAKFLADEIDQVKELGATGRSVQTLDSAAAERMPDRLDPEVRSVQLSDLLRD